MRLTGIPGPLADPAALSPGAVRAAFFWLLFFAVQRKVTRAERETLFSLKPARKAPPSAFGTFPRKQGKGFSRRISAS
jgi:hypothetical protein